jgi:hypothetical protein
VHADVRSRPVMHERSVHVKLARNERRLRALPALKIGVAAVLGSALDSPGWSTSLARADMPVTCDACPSGSRTCTGSLDACPGAGLRGSRAISHVLVGNWSAALAKLVDERCTGAAGRRWSAPRSTGVSGRLTASRTGSRACVLGSRRVAGG